MAEAADFRKMAAQGLSAQAVFVLAIKSYAHLATYFLRATPSFSAAERARRMQRRLVGVVLEALGLDGSDEELQKIAVTPLAIGGLGFVNQEQQAPAYRIAAIAAAIEGIVKVLEPLKDDSNSTGLVKIKHSNGDVSIFPQSLLTELTTLIPLVRAFIPAGDKLLAKIPTTPTRFVSYFKSGGEKSVKLQNLILKVARKAEVAAVVTKTKASADKTAIAKLESRQSKESQQWLWGHRFVKIPDEEFRLLVYRWIDLPVPHRIAQLVAVAANVTFSEKLPVTYNTIAQALISSRDTNETNRHNTIRDLIAKTVRESGSTVQVEPPVHAVTIQQIQDLNQHPLPQVPSRRRADVLVIEPGALTFLDVVIASREALSHAKKTVAYLLDSTAAAKKNKYKELFPRIDGSFVPFVADSTGFLHPEAIVFLARIARLTAAYENISYKHAFYTIHTRLSVGIAVAHTRMISSALKAVVDRRGMPRDAERGLKRRR